MTKDALSAEQIELINAYGPYNHAVWAAKGISVSNEERLSGRGEFIVSKIRECITKNFSPDEIRNLSILDVGCYDGWILHQLSDIKFRRMVGVEPREKNIIKGKKVREILNIQTPVEFRIGEIDNLGDEKFDIVICTGVLHHLESIPAALRNLRRICNKMLFVETLCLSSNHITSAVKKDLEMKDIVYQYKGKVCGLTGQKFESSYYDGSASELSVVSIPSVESLMMYMDANGFKNIEVVADPHVYWKTVLQKSGRPVHAVCICALRENDDNTIKSYEHEWVQNYERGLSGTLINKQYIEPLYHVYCSKKKLTWLPLVSLNIFLYLRISDRFSGLFAYVNKRIFPGKYEQEIIKNLRFNPQDKLRLEYGKILYHEGDYKGTITVLNGITQKINADWRSVYRSFYLLSCVYRELDLKAESLKYRELCLICNPNFPKELLDAK